MNKQNIKALPIESAKSIKLKRPEDLNQFSHLLEKATVAAALNRELTEYIGYEAYPRESQNAHNGYCTKTINFEEVQIDIVIPCDCNSAFEPQSLKKNQILQDE